MRAIRLGMMARRDRQARRDFLELLGVELQPWQEEVLDNFDQEGRMGRTLRPGINATVVALCTIGALTMLYFEHGWRTAVAMILLTGAMGRAGRGRRGR